MAAPSTNQTDLNFGEEQADVKGQEEVAPEGIGLRSIAQGFAAMGLSDDEYHGVHSSALQCISNGSAIRVLGKMGSRAVLCARSTGGNGCPDAAILCRIIGRTQ